MVHRGDLESAQQLQIHPRVKDLILLYKPLLFHAIILDLNKTSFGNFGSNQPQPTQPQQDEAQLILQAQATAIAAPQVFNDERDELIAKWNQMQAFFGMGKAYYGPGGANAVDFGPDNPWCRFKAVNYARMSQYSNTDGLVALTFNKKEPEIKQHQQQV